MVDPHAHADTAEERAGDPEHHHRGPAAEELGAFRGVEEPHHTRRSAQNLVSSLGFWRCCRLLENLNQSLDIDQLLTLILKKYINSDVLQEVRYEEDISILL